jgi:hypothetical protein
MLWIMAEMTVIGWLATLRGAMQRYHFAAGLGGFRVLTEEAGRCWSYGWEDRCLTTTPGVVGMAD